MTTKKRLIVSLAALCLVMIMMTVSAVAVFAYERQTTTSGVNVTYVAKHVVGSVKITESYNSVDTLKGTATFDGYEKEDKNTAINPTALELSTEKNSVVYKFDFTNSSEENPYIATLSYTAGKDDTNMTVEYSADGATYTASSSSVTVAAGATGVYYVKVTVTDTLKSAALDGTFTWVLAAQVKA
jgi:hypothetical protein